jgi:hypothetical protein
MHQALKIFCLAAFILIAAFFANYFGFVSIPWLDVDMGPTYGGEVKEAEKAVQKAIAEEKSDYSE